jgi:DNA modification methylase
MPQSDEQYLFHQTPVELAKKLIDIIYFTPNDTVCEPFRGEGAFYNNLPEYINKDWSEIRDGRNYTHFEDSTFDWVISNPPFKIEVNGESKNMFFKLLEYWLKRANKGVAFLMSDVCFGSLTPVRMAIIKELGFSITKIVICNVKKWRGRYYFIIFEKTENELVDYLPGTW